MKVKQNNGGLFAAFEDKSSFDGNKITKDNNIIKGTKDNKYNINTKSEANKIETITLSSFSVKDNSETSNETSSSIVSRDITMTSSHETKQTSVKFTAEIEQYIRIRSAQLRVSQFSFVENLMKKERDLVLKENLQIDPYSFSLPEMGKFTKQKTLIFDKTLYDWFMNFYPELGVKKTEFINWIVYKDMKKTKT